MLWQEKPYARNRYATYIKQDSAEACAKLAEMKRALEKEGVDVAPLSDEES